MARIAQQAALPGEPGVLSLAIRPWVPAAARPEVVLDLEHCLVSARSAIWAEIIYALNEAPLFYSRYLLNLGEDFTAERLERVLQGERRHTFWQGFCPETRLMVSRTFDADDGPRYRLHLWLNLGGFYRQGGSKAGIELVLDDLSGPDVRDFVEQLARELEAVQTGWRPAPVEVPAAAVGRTLTARAFDALGESYRADYFADPFFRQALDGWLGTVPAGGHVLDVGCGHGRPVAEAIVARGYRLTGLDVSAGMIGLARANVPQATFLRLSPAELAVEAEFDGACAFFSLLHLDPIELRLALPPLHRALKPGGHLLLVSGLPEVNVRRAPLTWLQGQPVWEWSYEPAEVRAALAENGLFAVVDEGEWRPGGPALAFAVLARKEG